MLKLIKTNNLLLLRFIISVLITTAIISFFFFKFNHHIQLPFNKQKKTVKLKQFKQLSPSPTVTSAPTKQKEEKNKLTNTLTIDIPSTPNPSNQQNSKQIDVQQNQANITQTTQAIITQDPNPVIACQINEQCGGGIKMLARDQCYESFCCYDIGKDSYTLTTYSQCQEINNDFYHKLKDQIDDQYHDIQDDGDEIDQLKEQNQEILEKNEKTLEENQKVLDENQAVLAKHEQEYQEFLEYVKKVKAENLATCLSVVEQKYPDEYSQDREAEIQNCYTLHGS